MTSPTYEDTISPSVPLGLAQTLSALNNSRGEEMEGEVANEMEEIETDDDIPVYSRVHIKVKHKFCRYLSERYVKLNKICPHFQTSNILKIRCWKFSFSITISKKTMF